MTYEETDTVKPEELHTNDFTTPDTFQVSITSPSSSPPQMDSPLSHTQKPRPGPSLGRNSNPKKQTLPLPGKLEDKEKKKERSKTLGKRYSAPLINVVEYSQ